MCSGLEVTVKTFTLVLSETGAIEETRALPSTEGTLARILSASVWHMCSQ